MAHLSNSYQVMKNLKTKRLYVVYHTKQYYSRIAGLMDAGLIKRHKGKYSLTLLGKVVYDSQMMIGKALAHHWKLKALESIEMSAGASFPEGELTQLIDALIDNHQIKDILMESISTKEDTKNAIILRDKRMVYND